MTRILIFDSGVGGIAISKAIKTHLGTCELHLVIDNDFFPYGDKDEAQLTERVSAVLAKANALIMPDVIVIACNTASTLVLESLRSQYDIPIVGVVPAVKPAAAQSQSHFIGVIATPATVERDYTHGLIDDFAPHCEVLLQGSSELVHLAEDWAYDGIVDEQQISAVLAPFKATYEQNNLDTLVLACTHFPLLKKQIQRILSPVKIIDSSDAIGRQVIRVLEHHEPQEISHEPDTIWHTAAIGRSIAEESLMSHYKTQILLLNQV